MQQEQASHMHFLDFSSFILLKVVEQNAPQDRGKRKLNLTNWNEKGTYQ